MATVASILTSSAGPSGNCWTQKTSSRPHTSNVFGSNCAFLPRRMFRLWTLRSGMSNILCNIMGSRTSRACWDKRGKCGEAIQLRKLRRGIPGEVIRRVAKLGHDLGSHGTEICAFARPPDDVTDELYCAGFEGLRRSEYIHVMMIRCFFCITFADNVPFLRHLEVVGYDYVSSFSKLCCQLVEQSIVAKSACFYVDVRHKNASAIASVSLRCRSRSRHDAKSADYCQQVSRRRVSCVLFMLQDDISIVIFNDAIP